MEQIAIKLFLGFLALMSVIGFIMMGIDKRRAIKKAWRISERTLILIAFLGGGIGSFIGMFTFHHKTKHANFIVLLPLSAIIYLAIMIKLIPFIL